MLAAGAVAIGGFGRSRWRLRRMRDYLWDFNRLSLVKSCQKLDSAQRHLLIVVDLDISAWFGTRLIVTRDSIISQARNLSNLRCGLNRARGSVRRASDFVQIPSITTLALSSN